MTRIIESTDSTLVDSSIPNTSPGRRQLDPRIRISGVIRLIQKSPLASEMETDSRFREVGRLLIGTTAIRAMVVSPATSLLTADRCQGIGLLDVEYPEEPHKEGTL